MRIDRRQAREIRQFQAEPTGVVDLRHQADIGEADPIAEAAGAAMRGDQSLQRPEAFFHPMTHPDRHHLIPLPQRAAQIIADPEIIDRMDVGDHQLGHPAHHAAIGRALRQQGRLGVGFFEIFENGHRLAENMTVDLQGRHQPLRIERQIVGRALFAFGQMDGLGLEGNALPRQSGADAIGGGTAEIAVKHRLGHWVLPDHHLPARITCSRLFKMLNFNLYFLTVSIWGSTWLVITFQLGSPIEAAVGWRFLLAALLLLGWCGFRRLSLKLTPAQYAGAVAQGLLNFCINYWMVYQAEERISSGLVAVIFSLLMVFNMIGGRLFFGQHINRFSAAGAALGLAGVLLVFWPEVANSQGGDVRLYGTLFALGATCFSSCGNLMSLHNQRAGIPLIPGITIGMGAGGLAMLGLGWLRGEDLSIPATPEFLLPLLYLALFGSVIAFI